jgi:hypothetical protein
MNVQILIHSVVQQTMVFIAQLATAGGVRTPLAQVANQALLELITELQNQGLKKNVIADMFGMSLRTYHRRVRELSQSRSVEGRTVWEALLEFIREREPVAQTEISRRFANDEREVVAGVLNDLVNTGIAYRSGRGAYAVYRAAAATDFLAADEEQRTLANEYLVWQAVYRGRPIAGEQVVSATGLPEAAVSQALDRLLADGRVCEVGGEKALYTSDRLDVPVGQTQGWEAAVFDHFQAMVGAIASKLSNGEGRAEQADVIGGATYSLDLWPGHPLAAEARGTLSQVRRTMEDLRARIDRVNQASARPRTEQVIFYMGQYVKSEQDWAAPQTIGR